MKTLKIILFSFIFMALNISSSAIADDRYTLSTQPTDMTKQELKDLELFTKLLTNHISKIAYRTDSVPRNTPIHAMNFKIEQTTAGVSITTTFAGMVYCTEDPPGQSCMGGCPCY